MRFGITILPELRWADAQHRWRRAEELGFDHAWTYDHIGWRDLVEGPWFDAVPTLTAAAGRINTLYGELASDWRIEDGQFKWTAVVPPNTTATAILPDGTVQELAAGEHEMGQAGTA